MNKTGPIAKQFDEDHMSRATRLEEIRQIAIYTIPSAVPQENQDPNTNMPQTFQSVGSRGVINLEGKVTTAMFPAGTFWGTFNPSEHAKSDPAALAEAKSPINGEPVTTLQAFEEKLFLRELKVQAQLDQTNYRNQMRMAIRYNLIAGSSVSKVMDDYNVKTFREDQTVIHRDPSEKVIYLITKECRDVLTIDDAILAKAGIEKSGYGSKGSKDRNLDIFTRASLQSDGKWLIEQEINGSIIGQSEEPVSPYIVGAYDLMSGEDYGRPFCDLHKGDLRSINGLYRSMLEVAAVMGRLITVIDDTQGTTRKRDVVETSNGGVILGRVVGGTAQDVALLQAGKFGDLQGIMAVAAKIEERLNKAFLIESELQPTGDRVTAFQVARLAAEIEGGLGGIYSAIAARLQRPLLDRVTYQMTRDKLLEVIPNEYVKVQTLTGLEALSRERDFQKLQFLVQMLPGIPSLQERIDMANLGMRLLKNLEVDPRGLLKSEAKIKEEKLTEMKRQLEAAAAGQAIQSVGKIAETQAAKTAA